MIRRCAAFLRRFGRDESGNGTIELVLALPLVFTLFMTSIELGIHSMRQMWLERGMDVTVRSIRLGTGNNLDHDALKTMICDNSGFLPGCHQTLRLEMITVNPRNFSGFSQSADCIDVSEPVTPLRQFVHGASHQLMLLRACYMFKPVFALNGLGRQYTKDGSGRVKMAAVAVFVQEPV